MFNYEIGLDEGGGVSTEWSSWLPIAYPMLTLSSQLGPVRLYGEGGAIRLSVDSGDYAFAQFDLGAGYRLFGEGERLQGILSLGYRYLFFDHERDLHAGEATIDATVAGPYLGFTLVF